MPLEIESYAISDIGLSRSNNEDVFAELPDLNFYALADGMGGHKAGEVAAKETVLHICDAMDLLLATEKRLSLPDIVEGMKKAIVETNNWIRTLAREHPELSGMGTTFCSLLLYRETVIYAHVGDSRIYRFRNALERLTSDHSLRQELISTGDLTEVEAADFPMKNVLTKAIGTSSLVDPDIGTLIAESGDLFFLCSDGLTDFVSDSEIEKILRQKRSLKETGIQLVEEAKAKGGGDNITALLMKVVSYEPNLS